MYFAHFTNYGVAVYASRNDFKMNMSPVDQFTTGVSRQAQVQGLFERGYLPAKGQSSKPFDLPVPNTQGMYLQKVI